MKMNPTYRLTTAGVTALTFALLIPSLPASAAASCESLASLRLPQTTITRAESVGPDGFSRPALGPGFGPEGQAVATRAPFCRVAATLEPSSDSEIKIEVWLPSEGWNGKFQAVGNGNWGGIIHYPAMADALAAGYATSSTDTGHEGMLNARFALGHPEKLVDYAYRSIHEMTVKAKAVIEAFYGRAPAHSYFNGRSTGGRQAIMEAERYPADFDGIVAGSIANPKTHLDAWRIASAQVMFKTPEGTIPPTMFPMIHKAVLASCDALDGLTDGLIDDPRRCRFDPRTIECKPGDAAALCLSPAQVAVARALMAPLRISAGVDVFPGFAAGTELGWDVFSGGPLENALEQYKYVVFADAAWDWHTFELERDLARAERIGRGTLAPVSPDLTAFAQRGGKLLMYHGWADRAIPGQATVDYYTTTLATSKAPDTNRSWVTLFMVPGMDHGLGTGEGPNVFDMMSPLDAWVTTGKPPNRVVASHKTGEQVDRTRPLCAYPQVARYTGSGSIDDAANFVCRTP
jgi:feruloyl esterase